MGGSGLGNLSAGGSGQRAGGAGYGRWWAEGGGREQPCPPSVCCSAMCETRCRPLTRLHPSPLNPSLSLTLPPCPPPLPFFPPPLPSPSPSPLSSPLAPFPRPLLVPRSPPPPVFLPLSHASLPRPQCQVVYRGLRDRMGDTKRRAARIVGNMCTLINDPKVSKRGCCADAPSWWSLG